MGLTELIDTLDKVGYSPRLLQLRLPQDCTEHLSDLARAFFEIAYGKYEFTAYDFLGDSWKEDDSARGFFSHCPEDVQTEILAFLTLFVHEYTHRIDFLISPFGLQYYVNSLREYWLIQEFLPTILDDPYTIDSVRFLADFRDKVEHPALANTGAKEIWKQLESLIHTFYAWGDVTAISPMEKYVEHGWGDPATDTRYPFGPGIEFEPVRVLKLFHTFRLTGGDQFWYLRPLTIFETKAVVNSLLFILHLFGESGLEYCHKYYRRIYVDRKAQMPPDYFFLLDMGARLCGMDDFLHLLQKGRYVHVRSTLILLSSICWFALQAPPALDGDPAANPILRLVLAFDFMSAWASGQVKVDGGATEILLRLDGTKQAQPLFVKPASEIVPTCRAVIKWAFQENEKLTWHPEIRKHFAHILSIMSPIFEARELDYASRLGMPLLGSPISGCRTDEEWELTIDDYKTPDAVREWFSMRTDLFFNLLKPPDQIVSRLDKLFMAYLIPYLCPCLRGMTRQWVSRFADEYALTCNFCGKTRKVRKEDATLIGITPHGRRST